MKEKQKRESMFLRKTKRENFNMVKMERQPLKEEPEKDNLTTHDSYYFLIKNKCHTKNYNHGITFVPPPPTNLFYL